MPVVLATREAEAGELLEPRRQKDHLSQEIEVAVNYDCSTAFQPGRQSETLSQKVKKEEEEEKNIRTQNMLMLTTGFSTYPWPPKRNKRIGQAWWLMPVIPALWEAEAAGSQDQEFKTSLTNLVKPHHY